MLWLVHIDDFSEASDFYGFEVIILEINFIHLSHFQAIFKALQQSEIAIVLKNCLLEWVQCPIESN